MATTDDALRVGVVGVGSMGRQHARVYGELPETRLVGVTDPDHEQARKVAEAYGATALSMDRLLSTVDAVSIAAPDRFHHELASQALDAGVHVLVEKPIVTDVSDGRDLVRRARRKDLVLQVGHVERFNPVVETLEEVLADEEIIAVTADRLGPPVDRDIDDDPVRDLMIHDIDVVCSLVEDADVRTVQATRAGEDPHATALMTFESGTVARLTASRITQQKVRQLAVTTRDARITVDYLAQSVEIHRKSVPEWVATDGDVTYRHEGVVERPTVDQGEPLKRELGAFARAVREGESPQVTGEDGLRALEVARMIETRAVEDVEPPEVAQ